MNRQVYITHIGAFLPNAPVANDTMESVLGQIGERPSRTRKIILRSNGIRSRHYAIHPQSGQASHNNAELTALAIRTLEQQGCDLSKVELLSCGTTLPDLLMPNHTLMVQGELGLPPCETVATAGICLSGMMALKYAYLSICSGECSNAVATGSENVSSLLRGSCFQKESALDKNNELIGFEKDFLRWMLSDGAGAVWMSSSPGNDGLSLQIDWIQQKSYAGDLPACMYAGGDYTADGSLQGWRHSLPEAWLQESLFSIKQNVKLLNEKIIEYTVTRPLQELVSLGKVQAEKTDWFLPHYSSEFFRDRVHAGMIAAGCDIPQERWFSNLSTKGNTGSASIFIIMEELFHSGRLQKGETILCYIPESGRFSTAFMQLTVV